jgi:hypothetical protein
MPSIHERNRHNALRRYRPADDPQVIEAARDLRAARLEDYIRRLVDAAPPLTPEQIQRLRDALPPVSSAEAA